jgi:hypothetical protein
MHCPVCSTKLPDTHAHCPVCLVTKTSTPPSRPDVTKTSAPISHREFLATVTRGADPIDVREGEYRYAAGDLLADRFRIVAPLGKGGMGEVYRADDLSLGVSVALKILPERIATNAIWLTRFRKEVAAARQVSHPHVCRVFDITESNGQSLLSMEFIAGDDLAAVLRKIGRLSSELAIDLTRQIAQGLHAVHDEGLIHRDLKPANIMIDGRGRAKLSDFGLATAASSVTGNDIYAGTPVYQAPEQLAGETLTERTDLYALGVLAYELLTGRRPFVTTDRDELILAQKHETPAPPSTFDASIPPEVDRIVLKCLAFDALNRPASAHEVYRTLPGDAALNAALAAGVTPSAEVVADAGGEGRLRRRTALLLAGAIFVLGLLVGFLQWQRERGLPVVWSPPELIDRCRTLLAATGHPTDLRYQACSYENAGGQSEWRDQHDRALDRASPEVIKQIPSHVFSYRVSSTPLIPRFPIREQPIITADDPSFGGILSAMVTVDSFGRLVHIIRMLPSTRSQTAQPLPDWPAWFQEAGFEFERFQPVKPDREWTVPYDSRFAWEGEFPDRPLIPVTIEAATDRGELVAFTRVAPWTIPETREEASQEIQTWYRLWWIAIPAVTMIVGGWLAWRNVQAGTADVRGSIRFAVGFSVLHVLLYLVFIGPLDLGVHFLSEWFLLAARVLMNSLRIALGYLALEPFVRRHWPWRLIGWRRLLDGRWNDPYVGRDVLIGILAGTLACLFIYGAFLLPNWLGRPPEIPFRNHLISQWPLGFLLAAFLTAIDVSVIVLFLMFLLNRLFRTPYLWVPIILALLLLGPTRMISGANPDILFWVGPILSVIVLVLVMRYGLLVLIVAWISAFVQGGYPIFSGWGTWYWQLSALSCGTMLLLLSYGLITSVGGWKRLWTPETQL